MDLNTITLSDFVRNAEILWLAGKDMFSAEMRGSGIIREINIPQNTGNTREFSEIDLEQYAKVKAEREQAKYADVQQGYSKVGTLYRVALAEAITYEMRSQGKYLDVQQRLTNLLPTVMNRLELDLQHRFTFGTATSYTDLDGRTVDTTVGDTLALFSTAHTLRGSASTFRNRLANNPQVARGSLEGMEKMRIENSLNQFGEKVPVSDDILWTTDDPNTINTVRELLQSSAEISAPNAGVVNVYRGKYKHVKLSRVATDASGNVDSTKAKYWGLISSRRSAFYLGMHEEPRVIAPTPRGNSDDALTDDWVFNARGGWLIVIPAAGFASFSSGDGTA